jgi:hypothetical protein
MRGLDLRRTGRFGALWIRLVCAVALTMFRATSGDRRVGTFRHRGQPVLLAEGAGSCPLNPADGKVDQDF